jgi:N-acyl-D-amino-acid deacylase
MRRVCFLLLGSLLVSLAATTAAAADFDVLIRNARIVDGTGSPWFRGDVGLRDGRIAAMGTRLAGDAERVVDARERILAPGFIDVHTHIEASPSRDGLEGLPRADNYVLGGVTTLVTGNCGTSEIDIPAWRGRLTGLGINVATLVGHNSVRRAVMARENRAPTDAEMREMEALVEQAMRDGAVGFSTGLLYVPGTYAKTEEVVRLARVASRHGGIYASHIREQAARLHASIDEAVLVGREAGMPVQISHFKIKDPVRWGTIGKALALVDSHRAAGVDVVIDAYPYARASTSLGVTLPRWAVAGKRADIEARIVDINSRQRIVDEMKAMLANGGYTDYSFATVAQYRPDPELNGMTISQINEAAGREPDLDNEIATILEMMLEGGKSGYLNGAQMIYFYMSPDDVDTILRYPNTAIASDGNINAFGRGQPHPRSYGTNARVLAEYVRDRGVLSLEEAVRRMTSLPARSFGFTERGIVRPGFAADLVLFDENRVQDMATYEKPHQYADGFDYVFVGGSPVIADGRLTDRRPGQFIARKSGP